MSAIACCAASAVVRGGSAAARTAAWRMRPRPGWRGAAGRCRGASWSARGPSGSGRGGDFAGRSAGGRRARALASSTPSAKVAAGSRSGPPPRARTPPPARRPRRAPAPAPGGRGGRGACGGLGRAARSSRAPATTARNPALEQAGDQGLVAALGQGRGARRQAGGEAVGDPEPVLGAGRCFGGGPGERGRHEEGRFGGCRG